uniref:Import receptor subunit TOM5-like protein n=1 Tax=Rhizophora mucronata TaxID=61149 RepID=A0A2P2JKL4_RHIMU
MALLCFPDACSSYHWLEVKALAIEAANVYVRIKSCFPMVQNRCLSDLLLAVVRDSYEVKEEMVPTECLSTFTCVKAEGHNENEYRMCFSKLTFIAKLVKFRISVVH